VRNVLVASRFALLNALSIIFVIAMLMGGAWIWLAFGFSFLGLSALDEALGDDAERLPRTAKWFYEFNLYLALPILILITFVSLHHFIKTDPLGMIHALSLIGIEFKSARSLHQGATIVGTIFGTAYFYGVAGMIVGHELTHRTTSPAALIVGQALLAFSFNTAFSIAHVYGHHRNVTTFDDPGSARRGEYIMWFALRSMIWTPIEAFQIEAARLRRLGVSAFSWRNRALSGQIYSIAIVGIVAMIGGARAAAAIAAASILAQVFDKFVEYAQHYGLARVPGTPIEARHSWDSGRLISNALHYNLARHSDHHLAGGKPFWQLDLKAGAPVLPFGYQTAVLLALLPPLWHRMIDPPIAAWDRHMANDAERALIRRLGWELPQSAQHDPASATKHPT
jgi:alkane 1-monooxygenase